MELEEVYEYLIQSERRKEVVIQITQPLTVKQLTKLTGFSLDVCSYVLWELDTYELVECLNPAARRSRLYWLTDLGVDCQKKLRKQLGMQVREHDFPQVPWAIYGWVCFGQRSAVLKAIREPMQPIAIMDALRSQNRDIRMSVNNVRDVIHLFLSKEIVTKVHFPRRFYPRYVLTSLGKKLQRLLLRVEVLE